MFMKKIKESRLPPHPSKIDIWYHHQNQPKFTNNYFDISIFHNTVDAVCSMYCPIDNFREILVISSLLSTNKNFWFKSGKQWIPFSDAERHVKSQFISFWKAIGFNSQCRNDSIHLRPVVCENSSDMLTRATLLSAHPSYMSRLPQKPGKLHFWAIIPWEPGKWHFLQGKERLKPGKWIFSLVNAR